MVRGSYHPEGVSGGSTVHVHGRDGSVRMLPFELLRDVDGDGALDGVLLFETEEIDQCRIDSDVWARVGHRGPRLVAHRLADGGFSLDDEGARAARRDECAGAGGALLATDAAGRVDDGATARNVICQAADGRSNEEIRAELERECIPYDREDCPERRPRSCFQRTLLAWADRIETVRRELRRSSDAP